VRKTTRKEEGLYKIIMPPEENKVQDTQQQNNAQPEQAAAETPAPAPQPTESAPAETPIDTIPETVPEPAPVVEPPVEQVWSDPTSPEERPPSAPLPEDSPPAPQSPAPTQAEPAPEPPQPQIQEKIVYKTDPNIVQKLLIKARAKIQERKQKKLDKIMTLFEAKPQIRSKDVQKLLFAKKRTVTNYLDQLEREQKITQVGEKGKGVLYIKKQ